MLIGCVCLCKRGVFVFVFVLRGCAKMLGEGG